MVRGKLLIVEDDRASRDALQGLFISRGWEVVMTTTQAEGLAVLLDYEPDWIIVSWEQLSGTGEAFMQYVRADRKHARMALLTEGAGVGETLLLKRLRPDLRISKPFHTENVYRACESWGVEPVAVG